MKYDEVADALRRELARGLYPDRLPGERQVALRFQINFKTANKALGQLVDDGLVSYVRGKGAVPVAGQAQGSGLVGLVLKTKGHVFEPMTQVMIGALQRGGLLPVVQDTSEAGFEANPTAHLARVLDQGVKTLVMEGDALLINRPKVRKLLDRVPQLVFVRICEALREYRSLRVLSDYEAGSALATEHLAGLGHRRIALVLYKWIHGKAMYPATLHKAYVAGYTRVLKGRGLEPIILEETSDEKQRQAGWAKLLSGKNRPTAIFAAGDWRVVRAWPSIRQSGLSVPRDLALVGYENTPWSRNFEIPLTSISIQEEELGKLAVDAILEGKAGHGLTCLAPRLVIRKSCGSK
jgi:DNA-binding LacI/PurR family transcriptional regulator